MSSNTAPSYIRLTIPRAVMANEKRLIDANNLMNQVKAIHDAVDASAMNSDYNTGFHSATSQIQGLIAYMSTVDAVEVVRCKECKHCTEAFDGSPCCGRLRTSFPYVRDEDFCSYGERREGE